MSRRQLHEMNQFDTSIVFIFAARPCGMEARGEPRYRTQVNPCAGRLGLGECAWQHEARYPTAAKLVVGAAIAGHCSTLPQEISTSPSRMIGGRRYEGNDVLPKFVERSDHPIVALKPGNAGRAKGVTS